MKRPRRHALGAVLLLALLAAHAARGEDQVSGRFRADERTIVPRHACAYRTRDPGDPRRQAIEVVLSQGEVDADAAVSALSPHTAVVNQKGIGDYVLLWVHEDGSVGMNATFAATMTQYLDSSRKGLFGGGLIAEFDGSRTADVSGRVHSAAPVKTLHGESYEIDVTVRARIRERAPGTALPAGGGDPGNALEALRRALARKDWPAMRARLGSRVLASVEAAGATPRESRDAALDLLDAWLPRKRMKITRGEVRGDVADLDVEGDSRSGGRALHLVRMVHEPDGWRFDQATMAGFVE